MHCLRNMLLLIEFVYEYIIAIVFRRQQKYYDLLNLALCFVYFIIFTEQTYRRRLITNTAQRINASNDFIDCVGILETVFFFLILVSKFIRALSQANTARRNVLLQRLLTLQITVPENC